FTFQVATFNTDQSFQGCFRLRGNSQQKRFGAVPPSAGAPKTKGGTPKGPALRRSVAKGGDFADAANDWMLLLLFEFSIHNVVLFRAARLFAGLASRLRAGGARLTLRSAGGLVGLLGHPVGSLHQGLGSALYRRHVRAVQRVPNRLHFGLEIAAGRGGDLVAQLLERFLRRVGEVVGAVADLDLLAPLLVLR